MSATVNQVREWVTTDFEGAIVRQGKDIYIPTENKWPHIHIGKDFIVYKKAAKNHSYFVNPGEDRIQRSRVEVAREDSESADIHEVCVYLESQF